jgi:hypothetical protein
MKKLLVTSALAGVMIGGSALAQTSITGELRIGYKAISNDSAIQSNRGFGTEQQINIQTKGKTNIGWDYAAGFSLENDGNEATQSGTLFNENVYMDFINGGTTLTIGRDHIQRSDSGRSNGVLFGYDPRDVVDGVSSIASDSSILFQQNIGAAPSQNFGIGIVQNASGIGNFSINFVPENSSAVAASESGQNNGGKSAYEAGFVGDLGVKGLNVYAFKHQESSKRDANAATKKLEGENYGIKYTMGQITAGYTRKDSNGGGTIGGSALASSNIDVKENHYGLAYAVNNNLTIGANLFKAEAKGASVGAFTNEAEIKVVQVGYNLGPVALTAGYAKAENLDGSANSTHDADGIGFVRLIGAF